MKRIITIGRQYGSGGHEIGKTVATTLGIPFYDRELILLAEERSGLSKELLEKVDETATNSFLYAVSTGAYFMGNLYPVTPPEIPLNDKLYIAQADAIRAAAAEGPCVIVGRCADAILAEQSAPLLSIFVRADDEMRMKNIMKQQNVSDRKAVEMMNKADRRRSGYYNYYTQKRWGSADSYDLVINHSKVSTEEAVAMICAICG